MNMKTEVIIKCEDNCSAISIDSWEDEDIYYITFYKTADKGFWTRLKEGIQYIFGKDIVRSETVLEKRDFDKIRNYGKS